LTQAAVATTLPRAAALGYQEILAVVSTDAVSYYCGMGLYDRDYTHESEPGYHISSPQSVTTTLVLINVGVYILQLMLDPGFSDKFVLYADWYRQPWNAYRLLTYGFLHDPGYYWHIIFNMFGLWTFGKPVEQMYGTTRFLWFYLTAIVFAGLIWSLTALATPAAGVVLGASGGVVAVVILFALNFPHAKGMVFPIPFPIPMWALAIGIVLMDLSGAMSQRGGVAFTAHLGGALFGWIFYQTGWSPTDWLGSFSGGSLKSRRPKFRVVEPDDDGSDQDEVDRILRKISESGKDSLTRAEQRYLERASQEFKERRR
jgi:membrane associated rhomboid family serine protease